MWNGKIRCLTKFPIDIIHKSLEDKNKYINSVLDKYIDQYLYQRNPQVEVGDDFVKNYGHAAFILQFYYFNLKMVSEI